MFGANQTYFHTVYDEVKAATYLYLYVSPWLLFFGTLGNVLSYIIMHKMSSHVWSTCLYMSVIPMVDLVILYVECGNNWIIRLSKSTINISQFLVVSSNAVCKVYTFLFNFILHLSAWLIVAMLGECVLSVRFTRQTPRLCTREHTRAVILLITVLLICVNIQYFWTYGVIRGDPKFHLALCTYIREWAEFFGGTIWPTINTTIGHLLPILVTLILCLIISLTYVRMVLSPKFRRFQDARNEALYQQMLDPIAFQEFQGTILAVGFAYLLLMSPQLCLFIYRYILFNCIQIEYTMKLDAQLQLFAAICHMLRYIFLSIKFAIYYISSRRFQREFRQIVQLIFKPFTNCTKHKYAVRSSFHVEEKTWHQDDDQTVRLVLDRKKNVTHALDNSTGFSSHCQGHRVTTDV